MNNLQADKGGFENFYNESRYQLVRNLGFLFALIFFLVGIQNLFLKPINALPYIAGTCVCLLAYLFLRKTKRYKVVALFACFLFYIVVSFTFFNLKSIHYATPFWGLVNVVFVFFVLNFRWGIFFIVVQFSSFFIYLNWFHAENLKNYWHTFQGFELSFLIEFLFIGLALVYLLVWYMRMVNHAERTLTENNTVLMNQNSVISKQKGEMELLLKEIHHRVKNNLQIISSLLRLQMDSQDLKDKSVYLDAINRVNAMGIIHEKMYKSEMLTDFNLLEYVKDLTQSLVLSHQMSKEVKTSYNITFNSLDNQSLVPIALLINELISNSIKHAFVNSSEPSISVTIASVTNKSYMIEYSDNGVWKENSTDSFGMDIIEAMTQQLNGYKTRVSNHLGTFYVFTFNNLMDGPKT